MRSPSVLLSTILLPKNHLKKTNFQPETMGDQKGDVVVANPEKQCVVERQEDYKFYVLAKI